VIPLLVLRRFPAVSPDQGLEQAFAGQVLDAWSCNMVRSPRDLADRMAARRKPSDGFLRETFKLPRHEARLKARAFLSRYPKEGYMSAVESWRELPTGDIEFTMRRLPSAD